MSQDPIVIGDGSGAAIITNANSSLNLALATLATDFAGLTAPASPVQYQTWWDTTTDIIKKWDGSNWIPMALAPVATKTASYAMAVTDVNRIFQANHATVGVEFTLVAAAGVRNGSWLIFYNYGAATATLIGTVDGVVNPTIPTGGCRAIFSDGSAWRGSDRVFALLANGSYRTASNTPGANNIPVLDSDGDRKMGAYKAERVISAVTHEFGMREKQTMIVASGYVELLTNAYKNSGGTYQYIGAGTAWKYIFGYDGTIKAHYAAAGVADDPVTFDSGSTIWTSSNDGLGSGLDANLVNGYKHYWASVGSAGALSNNVGITSVTWLGTGSYQIDFTPMTDINSYLVLVSKTIDKGDITYNKYSSSRVIVSTFNDLGGAFSQDFSISIIGT